MISNFSKVNISNIKSFHPDEYSKLLPFDDEGDSIYSLLLFAYIHNRFPSDEMLFNDYLYRMKQSRETESIIRKFISDKEYVKIFVDSFVGKDYNIPTIAILNSKNDLANYRQSANQICKPTHASGQAVFFDGISLDLNRYFWWFDIDYYRFGRELNYKGLQKKAIVEPLIFGSKNPSDYKFFCYKGKPKLIQVDTDRFIDHRRNIFDIYWNPVNVRYGYKNSETILSKPKNLNEMIWLATKLSVHFEFIRVDIYSDGDKCYVGELTNVPDNACARFDSHKSEELISKILFSD